MSVHLKRKNMCKPILRDINIHLFSKDILLAKTFDETCQNDAYQNMQDHTKSYQIIPNIPTIPNHTKSYHRIPNHTKKPEKPEISSENTEPVECNTSNIGFFCPHCERKYAHNFTLTRHLKTCRLKQQGPQTNEIINSLSRRLDEHRVQIEQQQSTIDQQQSQINGQTTQLVKLTNNNVSVRTNNTNNNIQVNINVDKNRRNYSDTDYGALTDRDIMRAIGHAGRCMQEIIPLTHFNTNHPENQNIYVSSLKSPVTMLYEGNKWHAHKWAVVADRVIDNNVTTINEWIDRQRGGDPTLASKFKVFVDCVENDKFVDELKSEIKLILYNNRKLVHSNEMVDILQTRLEDGCA
jgi:hypothetical protein